MKYVIKSSKIEEVPAGTYQNAEFLGTEEFAYNEGVLLRWKWRIQDGKIATGVSSTSGPTDRNKLGRFLCALGNKPLVEDTEVDPVDYIGRKYVVFVSVNDKGKASVSMFSLMA